MQFDLPNIQNRKLQFLLDKGGKIKSVTLIVKSLQGVCSIDEFGRVEWTIKKGNPSLTISK